MVRRHGCHFPLHIFQVVAGSAFFLLAIAFYVFLAPFLGSDILEYSAMALYSPLALGVLLLYIRSSAIDPADPGIFVNDCQNFLSEQGNKMPFPQTSLGLPPDQDEVKHSPDLSTLVMGSSIVQIENDSLHTISFTEGVRRLFIGKTDGKLHILSLSVLRYLLCGWLVKEDNCMDDKRLQQPVEDDAILFCTLCNAAVQKYSKHCRNCDKCIDDFDHHCWWLNNCIGRRNYVTFMSLMASSLVFLILECGIGIAVLVQCFADKSRSDRQIAIRLGNRFSKSPFVAVVAFCISLSLLASIALGELFVFHIILIRKGFTTYEYVVAMRAQSDPLGVPEEQHSSTSPTSSIATELSRSSSPGLQFRGGWCTPPMVFMENQDEINPHSAPRRVPPIVNPDATTVDPRPEHKSQKQSVRISAWKLARLSPSEATEAVAKARESSSVLLPVGQHGLREVNYCSDNISGIDLSADYGLMVRNGGRENMHLSPRSLYIPSTVTDKDEVDLRTQSSTSTSPSCFNGNSSCTTDHLSRRLRYVGMDAHPLSGRIGRVWNEMPSSARMTMTNPKQNSADYSVTAQSQISVKHPSWVGTIPATDESDISCGESIGDAVMKNAITIGQSVPRQINRTRTAVFWDQEAGRFVSFSNSSDLYNAFQRQMPLSSSIATMENPESAEGDTSNQSPEA